MLQQLAIHMLYTMKIYFQKKKNWAKYTGIKYNIKCKTFIRQFERLYYSICSRVLCTVPYLFFNVIRYTVYSVYPFYGAKGGRFGYLERFCLYL